jgi:phosphoribosylaminoimidazole-succinocarboxamide synthase
MIEKYLNNTLNSTNFQLGNRYEGKVRDNYTINNKRYIISTDRISAFDHNLTTIPFKGQVLNQLSSWWFDKVNIPNHKIRLIDPNVIECIECEPIKIEMIVRAYITGNTSTSIWVNYNQGKRDFFGNILEDGLRKNQKLKHPILTPTTKAEKGIHDENISKNDISISKDIFETAADLAFKLFNISSKICEDCGIILVDTKYEFGIVDGNVILMDEINTPDSSRFWKSNSYQESFQNGKDPEPFDKDYIRYHISNLGYKGDGDIPTIFDDVRVEIAKRYIEIYETITGEVFIPNLEEPKSRILRNINAL